ncbi:MAG: hypothetical protein ACRD28_03265 [Acidobacteriaceae bacterium]
MLNHLHRAQVVERLPGEQVADDPHDAYLLNLACAVKAQYLVTGDKRSGILKRRRVGNTAILSAAEFCAALRI